MDFRKWKPPELEARACGHLSWRQASIANSILPSLRATSYAIEIDCIGIQPLRRGSLNRANQAIYPKQCLMRKGCTHTCPTTETPASIQAQLSTPPSPTRGFARKLVGIAEETVEQAVEGKERKCFMSAVVSVSGNHPTYTHGHVAKKMWLHRPNHRWPITARQLKMPRRSPPHIHHGLSEFQGHLWKQTAVRAGSFSGRPLLNEVPPKKFSSRS